MMFRTKRLLLLLFSISIPLYFLYSMVALVPDLSEHSLALPDSGGQQKKIKILIYGGFRLHEFDTFDQDCKEASSFSIIQSSEISEFDAAIIHAPHYHSFMQQFKEREFSQKKILTIFSLEPPFVISSLFVLNQKPPNLNVWTATYNPISYFYVPYGNYYPSKSDGYRPDEITKQFQRRSNSSVAIVSNCGRFSTIRLNYIEELRKHFPVKFYGSCGDSMGAGSDDEYVKICHQHKFYLAFENAHCKNVITEKYWRPLLYGAIPVVMGYTTHMGNRIPGSFINTYDYDGPQELAAHLERVASDPELYLSYFKWRRNYTARFSIPLETCRFAQKVKEAQKTNFPDDPALEYVANYQDCLNTEQARASFMRSSANGNTRSQPETTMRDSEFT